MSLMLRIHQNFYKDAFDFLSRDLPNISQQAPGVWEAFLQYSGLKADEAIQAVTMNGAAPLIFAANLGPAVFGQFDPQVPGRIEIASEVLDQFALDPTNPLAQQFLRAKVLHEICHWSCFRKQIPDDDQSGEAFEQAAFGQELMPDWTLALAVNSTVFSDPQTRANLLESLLTKHTFAPGRVEDPDHVTFSGANVAEAMPRGFRNNNPGNIRISPSSIWRGLADPGDKTNFQLREKSFCVFREPEWGLRAVAILLRKYKTEYGLDTPRKIISRWAPASDNNDVGSYAQQLAKALGIAPDDPVDATEDADLIKMMRAIARHENGDLPPYTEVQYQTALLLV
jgi:hypothetical protein